MNSDAPDMFAIRPDHKGPKTVAILLIVFSIVLGFVAKADLDLANTEEVSDAYMEQILETPNQQGDNVSFEQYQAYHQEVNDNNGYQIRGSLCNRKCNRHHRRHSTLQDETDWGKIALSGALVAFVGGIVGNMVFYDAANKHLNGTIRDNAEYFGYACGICTFFIAH